MKLVIKSIEPAIGSEGTYEPLGEYRIEGSVENGTEVIQPGVQAMRTVRDELIALLRQQYDRVLKQRSGALKEQIKAQNCIVTEDSVAFTFPNNKHPNSNITYAQLANIQAANNNRDITDIDPDAKMHSVLTNELRSTLRDNKSLISAVVNAITKRWK